MRISPGGLMVVVGLSATGCAVTTSAMSPSTVTPSSTIEIGVLPPVPPSSAQPMMMTTSTPTPPPSSSSSIPSTTIGPPRPLRLVFTGDVLVHSPLWRQALDNGGGAAYDFTPMFSDLRPVVEGADLAVCHMETPIAPPAEAYSTSPRYGVPAEVIDGLAAVGFDHCSTASNHTFDRGVAGVDATADRFDLVGMTQHGMARTPAERDPVLVEVDGVTIGLLSATYGFDAGVRPADEPWRSPRIDAEQLVVDATFARAQGADLVIVSLHWGDSNSHRAADAQREVATVLAGSGVVDLIVGHHAHVVQPIERIGDTWVAYGLGNVISNLPVPDGIWTEATRDGILLEVVVERDGAGGVSLMTPTARPVWVDRDTGWVVRDLATAFTDPALVERVGPQLEASWMRTAAVVGSFLVPR